MDLDKKNRVDFAQLMPLIESDQTWELPVADSETGGDFADEIYEALMSPEDFPSLELALVPGDQVAIAVDPNVPSVARIVLGATKAVGQSGAGKIEVVLTEEAREETIDAIGEVVDPEVKVSIHCSSDRDALRYRGADAAAEPIYMNRSLVDADFVLPIVVARSSADEHAEDVTGAFPAYADSASRFRAKSILQSQDPTDPPWQIGIQLIVSVAVDGNGQAAAVSALTPFGLGKRQQQQQESPVSFPEPPSLIVAALDGDRQQQSWNNAARAIQTAAQFALPGATIVLWSEIEADPAGRLLALESDIPGRDDRSETGDGFPIWDDSIPIAQAIRGVAEEYRLMIHSRIDRETVESIGLGVVDSGDELRRLSSGFDSCGVIRAAQFYGRRRRHEPDNAVNE